jgi:site-specific recombinase XerD
MHETMTAFANHLALQGLAATAQTYALNLELYERWLKRHGADPLSVTADDLLAYQRHLAESLGRRGRQRSPGTQSVLLAAVKTYYRWLARRGLLIADPAVELKLPRVPKLITSRDYLTLQEATALIQTQAARIRRLREGSPTWAQEYRNLAWVCLALATGRRYRGLSELEVANLDFRRNEVRCEKEKGKSGRVLPVASWAMVAVREYVAQARGSIQGAASTSRLFLTARRAKIGKRAVNRFLDDLQRETVECNPDLVELAGKHITSHSLRVSFAKLLFDGGCDIRTVNELMLHERLSTTARYTPVPLEDLRRACRLAHPRA